MKRSSLALLVFVVIGALNLFSDFLLLIAFRVELTVNVYGFLVTWQERVAVNLLGVFLFSAFIWENEEEDGLPSKNQSR